MIQDRIENLLRKELPDNCFVYGFADLRGLLSSKYQGYPFGISILRRLDDAVIDEITEGPTREYFRHYHAINAELNERVLTISGILNSLGIQSLGIPATLNDNELDEDPVKSLRSDLSHKMTATRAGLGWIGKTDLFISRKFGPRIRLASILLNAEVQPKETLVNESLCGSCSVCVEACPVNAANGKLWNIRIDRNEFFDPEKCMENCRRISKERLNEIISICGICVSVCPRGMNPK